MTPATPLEHLEQAPIDEVACGVSFEPLPELDPLVVGVYWHQRAADFPGHGIRTPIRDATALMELIGAVPPIRGMLVSRDDQFVIQLQADRFYLNWRRRSLGYPRFNNRGEKEGVLGHAMREYKSFEKFCVETFRAAPVVKGIELAKIDVIREGVYWSDLGQVAEILPCLRDFIGFKTSDKPSFVLRFNEPRPTGVVQINVALGSESKPNALRVLTLETRLLKPLDGGDMEKAFQDANLELNAVFGRLIPEAQRAKYFQKGRTG